MPISPEEFKGELDYVDTELITKLERKPYKAYEINDLRVKSNDLLTDAIQITALYFRLNELEKKGLVKIKSIKGKIYYISPKAL
jgi:hypothetical protein